VPDAHDLDRLSRGISLEGRRTAPAVVELTKVIEGESGDQALLSFVIREGRNRQVRNMCDAIGHPVVRLRRKRIGPIVDEHIRPGEFRDLTEREVALLRKNAPVASGPSTGSGPARARSRAGFSLRAGTGPDLPPEGGSRARSKQDAPTSVASKRSEASRRSGSGASGPRPSARSGRPEHAEGRERRRKGAAGDEVPRTKEAPPRSERASRSRRPPAGGRPRRG
jgi:hypothetical protein